MATSMSCNLNQPQLPILSNHDENLVLFIGCRDLVENGFVKPPDQATYLALPQKYRHKDDRNNNANDLFFYPTSMG